MSESAHFYSVESENIFTFHRWVYWKMNFDPKAKEHLKINPTVHARPLLICQSIKFINELKILLMLKLSMLNSGQNWKLRICFFHSMNRFSSDFFLNFSNYLHISVSKMGKSSQPCIGIILIALNSKKPVLELVFGSSSFN